IEKYCQRRLPKADKDTQKAFQKAQAKHGWTRLHVAVERGDLDGTRALLRNGVKADAQARDGRTALHLAADLGNAALARALVDGGAAADRKDKVGWLPVQVAAHQGYLDVVRLLADKGSALPDVLSAAAAGRADLVTDLLKKDPAAAGVKSK